MGTAHGDERTQQHLVRWAMLVGLASSVPLAFYLLTPRRQRKVLETDFDSFLVKQGDLPTGVTTQRASVKGSSGPFENFLKQQDERNPADFSTFLKSSGIPQSTLAPAASTTEVEKPDPSAVKLAIIYGTEYGFSREIAEKLSSRLKDSKSYWPVLVNMADYPNGYDLKQEQAALFICSTQGDGVPPNEARDFCEWLFAGKAGSLAQLSFSVCALGDRSYTHFCRCGKLIDNALGQAEARRFVERCDVNKEDWHAINAWMDAVCAGLPGLQLKCIKETGGWSEPAAVASSGAPKRWSRSRPYPACVVALEGLCSVRSREDKNSIRVELDLGESGLTYQPGDALGIYPINSPKVVDELLKVVGISGQTPVPVPSFHYEEADVDVKGQIPLRQALLKCYDLRSPKADILQLLWSQLSGKLQEQAAEEVQAGPLSARGPRQRNGSVTSSISSTPRGHVSNGVHANGNGVHINGNGNGHVKGNTPDPRVAEATALKALIDDEGLQQSYLAKRHVADVLSDFRAVKLNVEQLLGILRPLQPRLYSISSSPMEHPQRVQATIAEVKYECLGKERIGVCSTYVSERLEVGQTVSVYIHKNPDFQLPQDARTPIIMVGPGTGLAPFRAFILHRLLQAEDTTEDANASSSSNNSNNAADASSGKSSSGQMVLYFGCRRSDQDYLYGEQLEQWQATGKITLFTAFSREQAHKVYVQQRLQESGDLVWRLLDQQGGHFYVCGDAGSMAGAVEQALLQIIASHSNCGPAGAKKYLDQLSAAGRYQRDVWY